MAFIQLSQEVIDIIHSQDTIAAIATIDKNGIPHVTYKDSFSVTEKGELEFLEIIETSVTNKNLTYHLWFDKLVTINFLSSDKKSFLIEGKVERAIISGKEFEERYVALREKWGDIDLATVWRIEPIYFTNNSFEKRRTEEEIAHPLLRHLDRLVVTNHKASDLKEGEAYE